MNYGAQPFKPVSILSTDSRFVKVDNTLVFEEAGRISEWRVFWQMLKIRLVAFTILGICERDSLAALNTIYERLNRAPVPEKLRILS